MSERTEKIYKFIAGFIEREGYSPSLRDIVAGTTIPLTTVGYHLDILQGLGLITRRPGCVRTIRPTDLSLRATAGSEAIPSHTQEAP